MTPESLAADDGHNHSARDCHWAGRALSLRSFCLSSNLTPHRWHPLCLSGSTSLANVSAALAYLAPRTLAQHRAMRQPLWENFTLPVLRRNAQDKTVRP
jgi:hypothetical protein